jgi:hypothetical protein
LSGNGPLVGKLNRNSKWKIKQFQMATIEIFWSDRSEAQTFCVPFNNLTVLTGLAVLMKAPYDSFDIDPCAPNLEVKDVLPRLPYLEQRIIKHV